MRYEATIVRTTMRSIGLGRSHPIAAKFEAIDDSDATVKTIALARKSVSSPRHRINAVLLARITDGAHYSVDPTLSWVDVCVHLQDLFLAKRRPTTRERVEKSGLHRL